MQQWILKRKRMSIKVGIDLTVKGYMLKPVQKKIFVKCLISDNEYSE